MLSSLLPGPEPIINKKARFIPVSSPVFDVEEVRNLTRCVKEGWISSLGSYVREFEARFSAACGCRYGVSCSNGTAALHLALATLNIERGDEVIMPSFTMAATAYAALYQGAVPVFVDSEADTGNIDPHKIKAAITRKTKAIICVHIYGHPCDMTTILRIAHKYGIPVIEDAAEAHGAEYKGKRVGGIGSVGVFSFYGNKIITTGEGGMLVTNRRHIKERAVYLRNMAFSSARHFWHEEIGFNYRMTNLQAAVGVAQTGKLNKFVARKRANAELYSRVLAGIPGISLPVEKPYARSVFWMYGIRVGEDAGITRDQMRKTLARKGIETRSFFTPMHLQPLFTKRRRQGVFPVAESLCRSGLYLPSGAGLRNDQIEFVVDTIRNTVR